MTKDQVLALFRERAATIQSESSLFNMVIMELAQLLADSQGKLSKENFDTLVHIGSALYKEGKIQFDAKSDVDAFMVKSLNNPSNS